MKLYTQTVEYKVYEILESMLKISELKNDQYRDTIVGGIAQWAELCVTSFSFGRQSGHTSAALEYLYRNPNSYLVVHNNRAAKLIVQNHAGLKDRVLSAETSVEGLKVRFVGDSRRHMFILDSMSQDRKHRFFDNIAIASVHHVIKGMCCIGE
jgi:hypothetical protein